MSESTNAVRLYHLLASHWPGNYSGVPRFSRYFEYLFPDAIKITPADVAAIDWRDDDVVVTDNHLCLLLPDFVRAAVVHHGCAPYHYEVDEAWRNPSTKKLVDDQIRMFERQRNFYVAPSLWVWERFLEVAKRAGVAHYEALIVPHWVPPIPSTPMPIIKSDRKVVIGDWRNANKGRDVRWEIARACPEIEFRQLEYDGRFDTKREEFYLSADAYLCLSLSEGAPYAVADAERAGLPIVSTVVGNWFEFRPQFGIEDRNDTKTVVDKVRAAVNVELGGKHRFYVDRDFGWWNEKWRDALTGAVMS